MHQHEVAGPDAALMQPGGEAVQAFGKGAVGPGFGLTLEGFPKNERVVRPGARLRVDQGPDVLALEGQDLRQGGVCWHGRNSLEARHAAVAGWAPPAWVGGPFPGRMSHRSRSEFHDFKYQGFH